MIIVIRGIKKNSDMITWRRARLRWLWRIYHRTIQRRKQSLRDVLRMIKRVYSRQMGKKQNSEKQIKWVKISEINQNHHHHNKNVGSVELVYVVAVAFVAKLASGHRLAARGPWQEWPSGYTGLLILRKKHVYSYSKKKKKKKMIINTLIRV